MNESCPSCGRKEFIVDNETGEVVCCACGLVVREGIIDLRPEWREFEGEESRRRTGPPQTPLYRGLETEISFPLSQASPEEVWKWRKEKKWWKRVKEEKKDTEVLAQLREACIKLNIPTHIAETAALIYQRMKEGRIEKGVPSRVVVPACIYLGARMCGEYLSLWQIANEFEVKKEEVWKLAARVSREGGIALPKLDLVKAAQHLFLKRGMSSRAFDVATELMKQLAEEWRGGKNPRGYIAATDYIVSLLMGERIIQRKLAHFYGITEVTLRHRAKEISKRFEFDVYL